MAFSLSLYQTEGKTPELVIPLRGGEMLYLQALKEFHWVNEVERDGKEDWDSASSWDEKRRIWLSELFVDVL